MTVRIGVKLPHSGRTPAPAVPDLARALEDAGFDSLWVSDHVVMPEKISSFYPFADDGIATWPSDTPYIEALISLAAAAAVTTDVMLGTAVLVLPQRNPVLLAKQLASIDAVSGGRLVLGVGAGWLAEEFAALNAEFRDRGARMEEWIGLLRDCWTGRPDAHVGPGYVLPPATLVLPAPVHPVPVLVGGHSPRALNRAGRLGDGWLGQQAAETIDPVGLRAEYEVVRQARAAAGRTGRPRLVLRLVGSLGLHETVADRLPDLRRAGVDEIIVDVDPLGSETAAVCALLREAANS